MQITLITSRSVVCRSQQLASTPLELVPEVEHIGLVVVDRLSKAEEPD